MFKPSQDISLEPTVEVTDETDIVFESENLTEMDENSSIIFSYFLKYKSYIYGSEITDQEVLDDFWVNGVDKEDTTFVAIKESNPKICNYLQDIQKNYCNSQSNLILALKFKDLQFCNNIIEKDWQNVCFSLFDQVSCSQVVDLQIRDFCLFSVNHKLDFFDLNFNCNSFGVDLKGYFKDVCLLFESASK